MVLPLKKAAPSSCCADAGTGTSSSEIARAARHKKACTSGPPRAICARAGLIALDLSKTLLDRATNDRVTFANDFFQLFAVQDLDDGPAVFDRLRIPQRSRRARHARST